jgi:hypothetical protein
MELGESVCHVAVRQNSVGGEGGQGRPVVTECEDHESLVRPVDIESPRVIIIIQVSENV